MIRVILFLILACLLGAGFFWLSLNSGNLSFVILDYNIETKVPYAAIIILAAILFANFALIFLYKIASLPSFIREALQERSRNRRELLLVDLIDAISTNNAIQTSSAFKKLGAQNFSEKIAAQLAAFINSINNSQDYTASLLTLLKYPDLKIFAYTKLIENASIQQDWQTGCNFCVELWSLQSDEKVAKQYIRFFYAAQRYRELLDFLNQFKMLRILKKNTRNTLEGLCYFNLAEKELVAGSMEKFEIYINDAVDKLPEFLPALRTFIEQKIQDNSYNEALRTIMRIWKKTPHPVFSKLLLKLSTNYTAEDFYKMVRKLVASNPNHYESHLLLAEHAMTTQQFDIASKEISEALGQGTKTRALALMGRLCLISHENIPEAQEWLKQLNNAEPDIFSITYYLDLDELKIVNLSPKTGFLIASV